MNTILAETLRTHIEMATIALAITGQLDQLSYKHSLSTAIFKAVATKIGVEHVLYRAKALSFHAGEIFVVRNGETLAHFTVAKSGELTLWPWEDTKAA